MARPVRAICRGTCGWRWPGPAGAMTVWDRAMTMRQRPGPPRISRASRILTSMITGPAMAWKGGLHPERLAPAKASFRLASRTVFAADPALVAERVHAAEHE